jgi:hypothetical protein
MTWCLQNPTSKRNITNLNSVMQEKCLICNVQSIMNMSVTTISASLYSLVIEEDLDECADNRDPGWKLRGWWM